MSDELPEHASAPWRWDTKDGMFHTLLDVDGYPVISAMIIDSGGGSIICQPEDARLLQFAPDLLAALQGVVDTYDYHRDCLRGEQLEEIRTLVKKVKHRVTITNVEDSDCGCYVTVDGCDYHLSGEVPPAPFEVCQSCGAMHTFNPDSGAGLALLIGMDKAETRNMVLCRNCIDRAPRK